MKALIFGLIPATAASCLLIAATGAHAELPAPVRAMIDTAIKNGDKAKIAAIVEVAKQTNPADVAEINAIHGEYLAQQAEKERLAAEAREQELRNADLFENWSGKGELGGFHSTGNSERVGVTAAINLNRKGVDWSHKLRGRIDYQRNNGRTSREKFFVAYEPRYDVGTNLFIFGLAQFERDRLQGFEGRYAVSGGVGYKLVDEASVKLAIKAGPAIRITDFTAGAVEESLGVLAGYDFNWRISDSLTFTQDTDFVAESGSNATVIVDSRSTSIDLESGLEAKVNDRLSTRFSYTVEYDSNPAAGAKSTDTHSRFSLIYGF